MSYQMAFNFSQIKLFKHLARQSDLKLSKYGKRWCSKYFLTTPIFYVNADPHIGHLYTAVIGDAAVRFQKLKNPNLQTKFMVGTDEHGTKVSQSAQKSKISVEKFCDDISNKYKELFRVFSIEADDFVRTTQERHVQTAIALWNKIASKDLIYKDKYSGWYCVSDEVYVTEKFLDPEVNKDGSRFTLEEKKPVQFMEEVNYKFKLSKFQKDLLHWVQSGNVVKPKIYQEELQRIIEDGEIFRDISVSRPSVRVPWGIPVPNDPSQTIYVWLDALSSYLCTNGYPDSSFKWPPDVQIIGRDIIKFHGVFWPAFLLAADLEPPKLILCHSHWVKDDQKMSKSKGNVVNPFEQINKYTSDGFRFFLLREGVPHCNGNYTDSKVKAIVNSELADSLGNLLSRSTGSSINKFSIFPSFSEENYEKYCKSNGESLMNSLMELPEIVERHFEEFNFYKGIDAIIATLHLTNKFFDHEKPWTFKDNSKKIDHLNCVLNLTMESLRVCGILLQPIIPNIATSLLDQISIDKSKRNFQDIRPFAWESENSLTLGLASKRATLFSKIK